MLAVGLLIFQNRCGACVNEQETEEVAAEVEGCLELFYMI